MRNSLYSSLDPQLCNYESNGIQMPLLPFSDISLNACGGSFFSGSQVSSDHQHLGTYAPLLSMESPQSCSSFHFAGWLTNTDSAVERTPQTYIPNRSFISDTEATVTENRRKRKMEYETIEENISMVEAKKKDTSSMEDKRLCLSSRERSPSKTREKKAQVKRSQKISDKITILQELVSPYGKTDTASVLQQAHTYIKYLQEQIEIFSAPYFLRPLPPQAIGSSKVDLRTRGLSLVPVSFTQKLPKGDQLEHSATRRPSYTMKY